MRVRGEVGFLKYAFLSKVTPDSRIFLIMEHEKQEYIGCVLFTDQSFCQHVYNLIRDHIGCSIADLGGLEIGFSTTSRTK